MSDTNFIVWYYSLRENRNDHVVLVFENKDDWFFKYNDFIHKAKGLFLTGLDTSRVPGGKGWCFTFENFGKIYRELYDIMRTYNQNVVQLGIYRE